MIPWFNQPTASLVPRGDLRAKRLIGRPRNYSPAITAPRGLFYKLRTVPFPGDDHRPGYSGVWV
jgi:hypothetical protein